MRRAFGVSACLLSVLRHRVPDTLSPDNVISEEISVSPVRDGTPLVQATRTLTELDPAIALTT